MRSVSGVLNRTVLATFGLLLVVVSFWLLASGFNAGQAWPEIAPFLASAQDPVASFIGPLVHTPWFLPVVALVSVLIVVAGLFMLVAQVPRKAAASPLKFSGSEGVLMATLAPEVLAQALTERAQEVPGVEKCAVWVTGSPKSLWVQAEATVSQGCEVEWAIAELKNRLNNDVAVSFGASPKQIDVLVRLERSSKSRNVSESVTGHHAPEITGESIGA